MSVEYGLLTGDLEEKKILKVLNDKLQRFFVEMTSELYNLCKSYKFSKMKKRNSNFINWSSCALITLNAKIAN